MKKDIEIPEVKDVFIAAVREQHPEYKTMDWNAYLVNDSDETLDTVIVVTRGYSDGKSTATMRHSLKELPPKSFAKIEFLQDDLLLLNNEYSVSFFSEGRMLHKKYVFRKNSINENATQEVQVMNKRGVVVV